MHGFPNQNVPLSPYSKRPAGQAKKTPNWFSAGCGLVFLVLFLLTPFYTLSGAYNISGVQLLSYTGWMVLPLILGVGMIVCALLVPHPIAMAVDGVTFVTTLILLLSGNSICYSGSESIGRVLFRIAARELIAISAGYGAILCLLLCVVAIILEVVHYMHQNTWQAPDDNWKFKTKGRTVPGSNNRPF